MSGRHYAPFALRLRTGLVVLLQLLLSLTHLGFCWVYWTFGYMAGEQKWFFLLLYGLCFALLISLLIYFLTPAYKKETFSLTRLKLILLILNWLEGGLVLLCYVLPYRLSALITGGLMAATLLTKVFSSAGYTKRYHRCETIQTAISFQLADARLLGWISLLPLWLYLAALSIIAELYLALGLGAGLFLLSLAALCCRYRIAKELGLGRPRRLLAESLIMLVPYGAAFALSHLISLIDSYPLVAGGCAVWSLAILLTNWKLINHSQNLSKNRSVAT